MKERIKKWLPWFLYPAFFMFSLALFALLFFPFDRARDKVMAEFNAQQRLAGGGQELQIGEMGSYLLTGVKLKDVKLLTAPSEPNGKISTLKVDEARVRLSILPLLFGTKDISYRLNAFGGEVKGSFSMKGKDRHVEVVLSNVGLSEVEPLVQALGLPVEGRISGTVKFAMPEGKASKANGTIALEAQEVSIGDGKAKLKGLMALPRLNVGGLSFAAEAKDGVLKISKFGASGKDLDLKGEGKITMREMAADSLCDVILKFRFNDTYRRKDEKTKILFGDPDRPKKDGGMFELDKKVKDSRCPEGYCFNVKGPLGKLNEKNFIPAGSGGEGSGIAPGGLFAPKATTPP